MAYRERAQKTPNITKSQGAEQRCRASPTVQPNCDHTSAFHRSSSLPLPGISSPHLRSYPPRVFSHLAYKVKSTVSKINLGRYRNREIKRLRALRDSVGSFVIVETDPEWFEIGTILVALRGTSFGMHGNSWRVYSTGAGSTSRKDSACFKGPMYRSLTH